MAIDPEKEELARALFGAWSSGDADLPLSLLTSDAVLVDTGVNETFQGHEAIRAFFASGLEAFPKLDFAIADVWTTGNPDELALRWDMKVTNAMTGKSVTTPGMSVVEFSRGKISKETDYYSAGLMATTFPEGAI